MTSPCIVRGGFGYFVYRFDNECVWPKRVTRVPKREEGRDHGQ